MISVYFTLVFLWTTQDFVSCVWVPVDFITVALGDSPVLNCTYNCSSGFVRGCWTKSSDKYGCLGNITRCSVLLLLSNVSSEDLKTNYTCHTIATDDPKLQRKVRRIISLKLRDQTSVPNWTVTQRTKTKNASLQVRPTISTRAELTGIKVLATVTVAVATVLAALAAYLCLKRNRQSWNCKDEPLRSRSGSPLPHHTVHSQVKGPQSTQSERVAPRIPTPDNESDTEVPYADIMITVRGVSTPELTQVGYLSPGDQREWWGDETRPPLHNSRSADRLHIPLPREVSRKISTSSEYAVITYA